MTPKKKYKKPLLKKEHRDGLDLIIGFFQQNKLEMPDPSAFGEPGSIYVCYHPTWRSKDQLDLIKTAVGTPKKFKLVTKYKGVPVLRELNAAGAFNNPPVAAMSVPQDKMDTLYYAVPWRARHMLMYAKARWESDPDQLNSILLETDYTPTEEQNRLRKLKNEIDAYNHSIRIKLKYDYQSQSFTDLEEKLPDGMVVWTTHTTFYTVKEKLGSQLIVDDKPVGPKKFTHIVLMNGKKKRVYNAGELLYPRLFSAQPRSFSRESKA